MGKDEWNFNKRMGFWRGKSSSNDKEKKGCTEEEEGEGNLMGGWVSSTRIVPGKGTQ